MRKTTVRAGAIVGLASLAGCIAGPPPVANRRVYYAPPVYTIPNPPAEVFYNAPARVAPPSYVDQRAQSFVTPERSPAPAPAPSPVSAQAGVPAGNDCGWWRLCNLPGWRYEN